MENVGFYQLQTAANASSPHKIAQVQKIEKNFIFFLKCFYINFLFIAITAIFPIISTMLKRILLIICFAGIAVYSVKIYQLKDTISFQPSSKADTLASEKKTSLLRLNFYIESDNAKLLQRCQSLFAPSTDKITMDTHATNPKLAILHVVRDFVPEKLPEVVQLQNKVKEAGCLTNAHNTFVYAPLN